MYKKYLSLCIMLLLCTQIAGCSYSDSREETVSDVQSEEEEPVEELTEEEAVESGSQEAYKCRDMEYGKKLTV